LPRIKTAEQKEESSAPGPRIALVQPACGLVSFLHIQKGAIGASTDVSEAARARDVNTLVQA